MATLPTVGVTPKEWASVATGPGEFYVSTDQLVNIAWGGASAPASNITGHPLQPGEREPVILISGERLWVYAPGGVPATLTVTVG